MFRRIAICLACALLSVASACAASSAEEVPVSCLIATAASGEIVVSTQESRERTYLLLPSCADFAALCLRVSEGAALTGTVEGARIEPEDAEWHVWDMGALFGDMAPGKTYPLCVETADGTLEVELMRSAELPSFHIALDATDLPEEYASATAYIHDDKENRLPGQLTVIQPDGSMKEYELSRLKGRGNTSWVASGEKRPYNITLAEKDELIEGAGGEVVCSEAYILGETKDFTNVLTKVKNADADSLFLAGTYTEGAQIAKQQKALGMDLPMYSSSSMFEVMFLDAAGDAAEGTKVQGVLVPDDPSEIVQNFEKKYKELFGEDKTAGTFSAHTYAAVMMISDAMKAVGFDEDAMSDYIAETTFDTIYGTVKFNETHDLIFDKLTRLQVQDGKFVVIE